jgi:hypothetical protein
MLKEVGRNLMLEYDEQAPAKSWLQLVLGSLIICSGTAGAVYLLWKIYWVAGVVIAVPVWILLADLFVFRRRSITWYLLDFLRFILTFTGTAVIGWYLWKINWIIGPISILPVFILLLNIIGFLTLPVYFIAPESRAAKRPFKELDQFHHKLVKDDSKENERPS